MFGQVLIIMHFVDRTEDGARWMGLYFYSIFPGNIQRDTPRSYQQVGSSVFDGLKNSIHTVH